MGAARSSERSDPAEEQPTGKRGEAASKADRERVAARGLSSLGQMSSAHLAPARAADNDRGPWNRRPANPILIVGNTADPATRTPTPSGWRLTAPRSLRIDPLVWKKDARELICKADRLAFPVKDDIPVMLEDEARQLPADEEV